MAKVVVYKWNCIVVGEMKLECTWNLRNLLTVDFKWKYAIELIKFYVLVNAKQISVDDDNVNVMFGCQVVDWAQRPIVKQRATHMTKDIINRHLHP